MPIRERRPCRGEPGPPYSQRVVLNLGRQSSWPADRLRIVLGEQEGVVLEIRPIDLHGLTYYDLTVGFQGKSAEHARLGPEGVPEGLQKGERVLATRVANMIIELRRP